MVTLPHARSLSGRLSLLLVGVGLLGSGTAAWFLDGLYRTRALEARREVLQAQFLALVAAAELDADGRLLPSSVADPRLSLPDSGLYASIWPAGGGSGWRSDSTAGEADLLPEVVEPGEQRFRRVVREDGTPLLVLSRAISWETGEQARPFVISVAESLLPYEAGVVEVRRALLLGALLLGLMLAAGALLSLRIGLRPLRLLGRQIGEIETGERAQLEGTWPRELREVASNLNLLLGSERARKERYRNTLGNLAHSLKTPLAVLSELGPGEQGGEWQRQLKRMKAIIDHQLQKASAAGSASGVTPVRLAEPLAELVSALTKLHATRGVLIECHADQDTAFPMDAGDFMELAGNLLDNACKFARGRVRVNLAPWNEAGWRRTGMRLVVEDDGPGIPPEHRADVLGRGARIDTAIEGQGIGLAATADIVAAHGGTLSIDDSALGGASVIVRLPGR
ncbi:MAG: ATP-binding protein [Steroidobacteraceae bacterium]